MHESPRPLVLIDGDNENAPAFGFRNDSDKIAYDDGAIVPPSSFPSGPLSNGGFPLISARSAFSILASQKSKGAPATTVLTVTSVTLGNGEFETDRGLIQLPAWLFGLQNVENQDQVLAVSPARIFSEPQPLDSRQLLGETRLGSDRRTLTVGVVGAPSGTGPCTASYSIDVATSATAVAIQVHSVFHNPKESGTVIVTCPDQAQTTYLRTKLAVPLGNRVLVDAASHMPVVVTESS